MDGTVTVSFSSATPSHASTLRYNPDESLFFDYQQNYDTWEISSYGPMPQQGKMTLMYQADGNDAVVLNMLLCGALVQGQLDCALDITINGQTFIGAFPVSSSMFFTASWYVPKGTMKAGWNTITVAKTGLSNVFVRSVTLLQYQMQTQQQTQWCWAAVSASTSLYFDASSSWTQCKLADTEFSQSTCCNSGQGGCPSCNKPYYLQRSLATTGNFANQTGATQTVDDVLAEIAQRRPVGVRIEWPDGSGHFVMVTGVGQNRQMLAIDDPWYGHSYISYSAFSSAYQGNGTWNWTYFVKP